MACLFLPGQAYADDSSWTITAMSGVVRIQIADERGTQTWRTAAVGDNLQTPFVVETGINGHAVLGNGSDVMNVNENSQVEISDNVTDRLTKAVQSLGNLLYQVLPGKMRRFEVHTPYLVSVVKGTTFSVQVTEEYATVSLLEGLVDVFATDHMDKRHEEEIQPGEVAIFGRGKTDIQVLEPSSRLLEPSLPLEENLKRLNEALKDLEPVAVEVVKLPVNTGSVDTGTAQADMAADVNAVEAESAGAAEQQRIMRDTDGGIAGDDKTGVRPGINTAPDTGSGVRDIATRDDRVNDDDISEEKIKDQDDDISVDDVSEEKIKDKGLK